MSIRLTNTCLFTAFLILLSIKSYTQILVSATSFNPKPGYENSEYFDINAIEYYGLQQGHIKVFSDYAVNMQDFSSSLQYAIVDNPHKLDTNAYSNLSEPDYQLVVSQTNKTQFSKILEYSVEGLQPFSTCEVHITYCNPLNNKDTACQAIASNYIIGSLTLNYETFTKRSDTITVGTCSEMVVKSTRDYVGYNGKLLLDLSNYISQPCNAISIKKIEIFGTPLFSVLSTSDINVCIDEAITFKPVHERTGTLQWQVRKGADSTWINLGTDTSQIYTHSEKGTYAMRYLFKPETGDSTFISSPITRQVNECCPENNPLEKRHTLFYENFGRLDLSDMTGRTYFTWDYSDPEHPIEVMKTTTVPFRWPLVPSPMNTYFRNIGAPQDGEYTVAAYLTTNESHNGYAGARLEWANAVTGPIKATQLAYDHSGKVDGAALFLNCPPDAFGGVIYEKEFTNLCPAQNIFFECWITVFTHSGLLPKYNGVNVKVRLTDLVNPNNVVEAIGEATREADGGGVWVKIPAQIYIEGNAVKMEIINNKLQNTIDGNDLVLDDIKLTTCLSPSSQCLVTNHTSSETPNNGRSLLKVFNLFGQEVDASAIGKGIFIYLYSDGSVEKIMH